jgi:hypothetical protein
MRQPLVPAAGVPERFVGLAWHVMPSNINHSGGTLGQRAFLMVCPEHGLAFAGLANAHLGDRVLASATRWIGARLLKLPQPPETPVIPVDRQTLDACVGVYTGPTRKVEVGRLEDALVLREISLGGFPTRDSPEVPGPPPPVMRCGFYAEDRLMGLDAPYTDLRAEIIRAEDGSVQWLRFGSRIHRHVGTS